MRNTIIALLLFLTACTDEPFSRKALEEKGYTNIVFGGYTPFGCYRKEQPSRVMYTATNQKGEKVSGVVCCGVLGCEVK